MADNWWDKYSVAQPQAAPQPSQGLPQRGDATVTNGAFMPALSSNTPPYQTSEDRANIGLSMILPKGAVQALQNTPGHAFRMEQAKKAAETQSQLEQAQNAGRKILQSYAQLRTKFDTAPDDVLSAAIGPRNTAELPEESPTFIPFTHIPIPFMWGPTTVDPKTNLPIAGKLTPVQRAAIVNPDDAAAAKAWDLQNLFSHDVHGLTNAFMSGAGKSLNLSDARQEAFDATMRDFMRATNRKEAAQILDHAKGIISNDFGIPPYMADKIIGDSVAQLQAQHAAPPGASAAANVPKAAVDYLQANPNPDVIQQFEQKYGAGSSKSYLGQQ